MTRLGTLRVTAPPPSPPQNSPPPSTTPAQICVPPQTPQTPSTTTPNPSPHPSPPTPSQQPPTPLRQPPLSKNLRWTAVALVSKLSKELERPSSAIADEVALAASHDMRRRFPEKDVAPVERNTRRRVYDALKVMVAVGCIQRQGKDLRWIGVDHLRYLKANNGPNIRVSLCESRRRIGRKKAMLTDMHRTIKAFEAIYNRHRREEEWRNQERRPVRRTRRIQFPMIVVNSQHPQVAYSPDRRRLRVATQSPFKIYSETDLVTMLAERTALKRPKITKKRKPVRGTPGAPASATRQPTPAITPPDGANMNTSSQIKRDTVVDISHRKKSDCDHSHDKENATDDPNLSNRNRDSLKGLNGSKHTREGTHSIRSKDSCGSNDEMVDIKEKQRTEPQYEAQVKREPEEAAGNDLREQMQIYDVPTKAESSVRHEVHDSESISRSALGTQGERDVSAGPLICDEELGIPPLADGDSSGTVSDDDAVMGWQAGEEGDNDFEEVFRPPIFRPV